MKRKTTLKDIAAKANVSISTVSRYLNQNYDLLSAEAREAVGEAIKELNYSPVTTKRTLKRSNENINIGVVLTSSKSEAMGPLLSGIVNVAENYNANVLVRFHDYDDTKERRALESFVNNGCDAIITIATDCQHINPACLRLASNKLPVVVLLNERPSREYKNISFIGNDTVKGALTGYHYLRSLGHSKILLLGVPGEENHFFARFKAIEQNCAKSGETFDQRLVVDCADSYSAAYQAMDQICRAGKRTFTAVFGMSDTIALGAWDALAHHGLQIPKDISVLGYDNLRLASYKQLTTLAEPMEALGTSAANMVMNMLNGNQIGAQNLVLQDSLQIRSSCGICAETV